MSTLFSQILTVVMRLLLVAAGLVATAAVAVLAAALGAVLLVRSGWSRLTGKPINPWGARMRSAATKSRPMPTASTRGGTSIARRARGDVTDVVAREPS